MSDSGDKKDDKSSLKKSGDDEFDWDAALDQWDKGFEPEVAKDRQTQRPHTLEGTPAPADVPAPAPPTRALYQPPTPASPSEEKSESAADVTRISHLPGLPPRSPKGGLRQLFGRTDKAEKSRAEDDAIDMLIDPAKPQRETLSNEHEQAAVAAAEESLPTVFPPPGPEPVPVVPVAAPSVPRPGAKAQPPRPPPPIKKPLQKPPTPTMDSDPPESVSGPMLLAPERREHDPDDETSTFDVDAIAQSVSANVAPAETEADDAASLAEIAELEELEQLGQLAELEDVPAEEEADLAAMVGAPVSAEPFEGEKPAESWLSEATRSTMSERATWLEAEARAQADAGATARGLLAVSEIQAILGEKEAAATLAREARTLASDVVLAHRQVRGLLRPDDAKAIGEAVDAALVGSPAVIVNVHEVLVAAMALRAAGDKAGAKARLEQAFQLAPTDARVLLARAANALSQGDLASPALRVSADQSPSFAEAVALVMRLRGAGEAGAASERALVFVPNDSIRRARQALANGEVPKAAAAILELQAVPELSGAAVWLSASLAASRQESRATAGALLKTLDHSGAQRALAARGIELGDETLLDAALQSADAFSPAERVVLTLLSRLQTRDLERAIVALLPSTDGDIQDMAPLVAAAAGMSSATSENLASRAERAAGSEASRTAVRLGRMMAGRADRALLQPIFEALPDGGTKHALALDEMRIQGRLADVSDALAAWEGGLEGQTPNDRNLAAALIAERANDRTRATMAYGNVRDADKTHEPAMRALASLDPGVDLTTELNAMADALGDGVRGAMARLEAVERATDVDDETKQEFLDRAHRADPTLPIAGFLSERIARRTGAVELVLRWIRDRRAGAQDPLESALDGVREALLVADTDTKLASDRLEEAHRARPDDVALRELYERIAAEPLTDGAAWREKRAASATGAARNALLLEAAHEYERVGDKEGAVRAATAAAANATGGLERIVLERTEIVAGSVSRLADELLAQAREAEDPTVRREAYERLADLDARGRSDAGSALLWHRTILDETPDHKPSLRHVEHALVGDGRDDEVAPIMAAIAHALEGSSGGECSAHAGLAARLRMRAGDWDGTRDLAELGKSQPEPALWALRLQNAHARVKSDNLAQYESTLALLERATRPAEVATLLVRAAEAAARLGKLDEARQLLDRAAAEDAGDVATWTLVAEARKTAGDKRGSAEALESVARTSLVREHQLAAWFDAGRIWIDEVIDDDRGIAAFEQAANLDIAYADVFPRLSTLYAQRGMRAELAMLLEHRVSSVTDPNERLALEVQRGRVLAEVGDPAGARAALEAALVLQPDHTDALSAFGDLCAAGSDWEAAEQAWVRLARLLATPDEQRAVYARLGELYCVHAVNLARAELAFKEVLKRSPDDFASMERLVEIYKRMNDPARAIEAQQHLLGKVWDPATRRMRLIELSSIFETTSHDLRKAEQTLETARREFPTDVTVLRALAEFYIRQKQMPAVHILLDRAAADARRAIAAGRFGPALFEMMAAVNELRGKGDAARAVSAALAAFTGEPVRITGAEARGGDPRLDDLLAPELVTPALRALLAKTGDALDTAVPLDFRAIRAAPIQHGSPLQPMIQQLAAGMGIPGIQIFVSSQLGQTCVPASSNPPTLVLGESLLTTPNVGARTFLVARALKLIQAHASAMMRSQPKDLPVLIAAWLQLFNPSWAPQGINPAALTDVSRRLQAALPRRLDPDVGIMALEVAGSIGNQTVALGPLVLTWADRTALLVVGNPTAALDGIAWANGLRDGAPSDAEQRAGWIGRIAEAKEIIAYSVSDAYAEARARSGLK
jgi:tetratricopeptide (TPR) repeat protein